MILTKSLKLVLAFVVALSLSFSVDAQSTLKKIVKNGEIRIGMSGNQPPFSVKAKDGSLIGYEVELAQLLAQSMNVKLNMVEIPFPELLPSLKEGKVDAVMSGLTITPERNLEVAFMGPYILSGKSILTKSSTLAKAQKADDINQADIKLATLRGSTSERFVNNYLGKASLTLVDNYDEAVKKLMDDEVDAMVADYTICALTQLKFPNAGLASLNQPLTIEPIGIALPSNDPLFLNLVQNYFSSLQLSGILDRLEEKWFQDGGWLIQVE